MHDTRGVTVHVRGVTSCCKHLPDPGLDHVHSTRSRCNVRACAIRATHASLRNAYAILGIIRVRVCKGRSVASGKAVVNEICEVTFRVARGSGMSLVWLIDSHEG